MKNKIFFPTIVALACLLSAFSTQPYIGKLTASTVPVTAALSCTLPAPSTFDGERTSGATAALSWSTVTGAAAYRLKVYDLNSNELLSSTLEYGTSKNLSGLQPSDTYRCVLASVCMSGATSDFVIIVDILE